MLERSLAVCPSLGYVLIQALKEYFNDNLIPYPAFGWRGCRRFKVEGDGDR